MTVLTEWSRAIGWFLDLGMVKLALIFAALWFLRLAAKEADQNSAQRQAFHAAQEAERKQEAETIASNERNSIREALSVSIDRMENITWAQSVRAYVDVELPRLLSAERTCDAIIRSGGGRRSPGKPNADSGTYSWTTSEDAMDRTDAIAGIGEFWVDITGDPIDDNHPFVRDGKAPGEDDIDNPNLKRRWRKHFLTLKQEANSARAAKARIQEERTRLLSLTKESDKVLRNAKPKASP
ncbi:hypothetical protein [Octadecabacter sp. R77987]|uniref:hypothetical protein n=1 Tax=Octadecabacter sp. R77987 TaxID=3093874 RepID=UPI00366E9D7F